MRTEQNREDQSISPSRSDYPWGRASLLSSVLWMIALLTLFHSFSLLLLPPALLLNLILQRILIHPARKWSRLGIWWKTTATISVLTFAVPLHISTWSQRTAKARFRQLVFNPIPVGVHDIEKREAMGIDGWIAVNFVLTSDVADSLLRTRPWQPINFEAYPNEVIRDNQELIRRRLSTQAVGIDLSTASFYRVQEEGGGISYLLVLSENHGRACVVYTKF